MLYYINATRKPNKSIYHVSELQGYNVCPSEKRNGTVYVPTGQGKYYDKKDFFTTDDFTPKDEFYTWNEATNQSAKITIERSADNNLFLKSNPNNTINDNLQSLANC